MRCYVQRRSSTFLFSIKNKDFNDSGAVSGARSDSGVRFLSFTGNILLLIPLRTFSLAPIKNHILFGYFFQLGLQPISFISLTNLLC